MVKEVNAGGSAEGNAGGRSLCDEYAVFDQEDAKQSELVREVEKHKQTLEHRNQEIQQLGCSEAAAKAALEEQGAKVAALEAESAKDKQAIELQSGENQQLKAKLAAMNEWLVWKNSGIAETYIYIYISAYANSA